MNIFTEIIEKLPVVSILCKAYPVWLLNCESTHRTIIDLFLLDVLSRSEFHNMLRVFGEVEMSYINEYQGAKRCCHLYGRIDYLIGHAGLKPIIDYSPPHDSHLVVVEAKTDWPSESRDQWLAQHIEISFLTKRCIVIPMIESSFIRPGFLLKASTSAY